jgi:hypothetical protein
MYLMESIPLHCGDKGSYLPQRPTENVVWTLRLTECVSEPDGEGLSNAGCAQGHTTKFLKE